MTKTANPAPAALEPLFDRVSVAAALGCKARTIDRMIAAGEFPKADLRVGRLPRWRQSTVADWIAKGGSK